LRPRSRREARAPRARPAPGRPRAAAPPPAGGPAPRAPAATAPQRAPAPPQAPVQAIRREAQATPAADSPPVRIDYGTEIELPSAGAHGHDPSPPKETVTTSPATAEAMRTLPPPRPPAATKRPRAPPPSGPRGAPATPRPGAPVASGARGAPATLEPETTDGGETQVRQIVVPVKLPPGARYEVVIRLQLDTT